MKVLVVEDSESKAAELRTAIEAGGVGVDDIKTVPDTALAKEALSSTVPIDLLILDLQIPIRFGDKAKVAGGADLIDWMTRRSHRQTPPHILAVTGFDLDPTSADVLESQGISVLHASQSHEGWKHHITGLTRRIANSGSRRKSEAAPLPSQTSAYAVLITAVDVEFDQVKRVFNVAANGSTIENVVWYRASTETKHGPRDVVVARASQMGMPAAAVLALKGIRIFNPQLVMQVGICAGVRGEVGMGDIIIPDPCWDWGSGKLGSEGTLKPSPNAIPLVETARVLATRACEDAPIADWRKEWPSSKPDRETKAHLRPAASGASVVAHGETVSGLQKGHRKLASIDMENYGLYFAAANCGAQQPPRGLAVKTVVDFADEAKGDDYHHYGAHMAARLAKWLVENDPSS